MASIGPEIPPDSSRAALSVRVDVKSSAVSDSDVHGVSWYGVTGPLVTLCSSCLWVPLHRAGLECDHAWSPLLLPPYPTYSCKGFFSPSSLCSNDQSQACSSSLFLPSWRWAVAGSLHICSESLHICSGPGPAWLSCRSYHRGSCGQESLTLEPSIPLLVPGQGWCCLHYPVLQPPRPAGDAGDRCCFPCCPCLFH